MSRGVQSEQEVKRGRVLLSDQRRLEQLIEERRALCGIILARPWNEMRRRQQLREVQAQIEVLAKRIAEAR